MDRKKWDQYKALPEGPRKRAALGRLLDEEENLIQYLVGRFVTASQYYTAAIRDDLFQAARIGVLRAIQQWDPARGAFLTVAWGWSKHEMQSVIEKSALPVTVPRRAHLPKAKQDAIAAFVARKGREPDTDELATMGVNEKDRQRARSAEPTFGPLGQAYYESEEVADDPEESPEARLDGKRDRMALETFVKGLSPEAREEFWDGKRPDLVERAKEYVEGRRAIRSVK